MITRNLKNKQYSLGDLTVSKINYGDIKIGDTINLIEYEETPKGSCSFYRCTPLNSDKVHYLFTAEVYKKES